MRYWFLLLSVLCYTNIVVAQAEHPTLSNKDVLLMSRSGLNDEIILEKVRGSACDFDTSPASLADLKNAGVSDFVILEMVRCTSKGNVKSARNEAEHNEGPKTNDAKILTAYTASFVKSDRKWKYGFRSEPYDKISDYLQTKLVESLQQHGLRQSPAPDGDCCYLTIELIEVTSHPAVIKKPGIDVTANLAVTDNTKRVLYSKGYRGESRTAMNTWGHVINHAVEEMAKNMGNDENLTRVLATGKP